MEGWKGGKRNCGGFRYQVFELYDGGFMRMIVKSYTLVTR